MQPLLYGELVPWYHLLDPPADHLDEATSYQHAMERAASPLHETEHVLGAGAGHNAFHLKRRFRCTLTDISPAMQARSRTLNPECEHVPGDMRSVRLGRSFDVVLVHDAVMYMTTLDDLRAAAATAFVHTRPGGAALFAPDCVRETWKESTLLHGEDDQSGRSLRCLEWSWDPDPGDDTFITEFALLLREGPEVKAVHDRHVEGLFPRATWWEVLSGAGFRVETTSRPLDDGTFDEVFLCRRP
jgi:hypothetical protein